MVDPTNSADLIKQVYESQAQLKVDISGESFSTKVLVIDNQKQIFITDEIIPKYGNELLTKDESYLMSQTFYDAGYTHDLSFKSDFHKSGKIHGLPAFFFSFPFEINSKSSYYSIEPRKHENVLLYFSYKQESYSAKVNKLNIRAAEFRTGSEIKILEDGGNISTVRLILPEAECTFSAIISMTAKYTYKIEYKDLDVKSFQKINKYLNDKYREEAGSVSVMEKESPRIIPGVLQKPILHAEPNKGKVFIVDDEILMTELFASVFKKNGYLTQTANTGRDSLDRIARYQPDVILLDINMPDYDGFTVCRRLKRDPRTKNIPIVMVSGARNKEDVIEAKEAGAVYYFIKTAEMDFPGIIAKIDSIIQEQKR